MTPDKDQILKYDSSQIVSQTNQIHSNRTSFSFPEIKLKKKIIQSSSSKRTQNFTVRMLLRNGKLTQMRIHQCCKVGATLTLVTNVSRDKESSRSRVAVRNGRIVVLSGKQSCFNEETNLTFLAYRMTCTEEKN